jgi:hypothetical protein
VKIASFPAIRNLAARTASFATDQLADIVTVVRKARSQRAAARTRALKAGTSRRRARGRGEDASSREETDPLAVASGTLEVASADGSVLGYEDNVGVRHPLF